MGIMDRITKAVDALTEDESVEKGNSFEKYVVDHFNAKFFAVIHWSTDITRKHDRLVESDMGPDLILRYVPTGEKFCVECKFRSSLTEGKLEWSKPQQLKRYQEYALKHKLPFFIVIGFGGNAKHPHRMFCLPLEEAKYPALFPSIFEKFERNPESNFFWKNGILS
jgi:hypothetical protein